MFGGKQRKVIIIPYPKKLKMLVSIVMLIMAGAILTFELPSSKTWTEWSLPLSGQVIALDPGHGGKDGGAISREGMIEKDITLSISLYLRDYLQQAGAVVMMTREDDRDLADEGQRVRKRQDLQRRASFPEAKKADLFLSIHLNSIPSPKWYGAQSFFEPNDEHGRRLATLIQDELTGHMDHANRKAKAVKSIYLLNAAKGPRALVEVGFLSNPDEARLLSTDKYQKQLAAAIYRGILRYTSGEGIKSP